MEKIAKSDPEWKTQLTPEQYAITRAKGTEPPFWGAFHDNKEPGTYSCVCCGLPLFSSEAKFDSGTGWPSFFAPAVPEHVETQDDFIHNMRRTEILCARCDAHLGHVFPDGPPPTGLRYCVNSVSLAFAPSDRQPAHGKARVREKATFAAGCFWQVEAVFRRTEGVTATTVGYTGGTLPNPTYQEVCTDRTGHAEAVEVEYDPSKISYEDLLDVFWEIHDPTTLNRQGPDVGAQYRSAIFFHTPAQQAAAIDSRERLQATGNYPNPIVTEITPASTLYRAEEYHQQYLEKRGFATSKNPVSD